MDELKKDIRSLMEFVRDSRIKNRVDNTQEDRSETKEMLTERLLKNEQENDGKNLVRRGKWVRNMRIKRFDKTLKEDKKIEISKNHTDNVNDNAINDANKYI